MSEKACRRCGLVLDLASGFYARSASPDGRQPICRSCHNAYMSDYAEKNRGRKREYDAAKYAAERELRHAARVERQYGLPFGGYAELLRRQGGMCAGCGQPPGRRRLAVDHDHSCCPSDSSCGACVRGLLCGGCNRALGAMRDDPELLMRLALYAEKNERPLA